MLLSLISASLGALLVPTLVSQNTTARTDVRRVHALGAAESGIDVAVGQIRAASTLAGATLVGVRSALPCGPFSGTADAAGGATYSVSIAYYPTDPVGQSPAWLAANSIACTAGAGTPVVPGYALLTSAGTEAYAGSSATRTISSTYVVHTTNANIAGGPITIGGLCFDAGTTPGDGTPITLQQCSSGLAQQKFAYTNNLTLQLVGSSSSSGLGECLDAGPTHAMGKPVFLNPCQPDQAYATPGTTYPANGPQPLYRQMWGYLGSNNFVGTLGSGGDKNGDGYCLAAQTRGLAGSPLVLGACVNDVNDPSSVVVDPSVGAGRAGAATQQYVNYKQFGRCLDVKSEDTSQPLISYPCKQMPFGLTSTDWNQQWAYNSTTKAMVTYPAGGGTYCLTTSASVNTKIYVQACNGSTAQQWTLHIGSTFPYATQATITDSNGKCLAPSLTDGPDAYSNYVYVAPCDGSTVQKWNGDPNVLAPNPLQNTAEQ